MAYSSRILALIQKIEAADAASVAREQPWRASEPR